MKAEAKDEESGGESDMENKANNAVPGEEADVRDVIYNLENFGIKNYVLFPACLQFFLCCFILLSTLGSCSWGTVSNTRTCGDFKSPNLFWPFWPPSTFCQVAVDGSFIDFIKPRKDLRMSDRRLKIRGLTWVWDQVSWYIENNGTFLCLYFLNPTFN